MDLNIRNIDSSLVKGLKIEAVEHGVTLRALVIQKLSSKEMRAPNHRVSPVRDDAQVPRPAGREPVATERPVCPRCGHFRHWHGGFAGACQFEGCLCEGMT